MVVIVARRGAAAAIEPEWIVEVHNAYIPVARVCVATTIIGVPDGAQIDWLSKSKRG
jgi:hypothetical protein